MEPHTGNLLSNYTVS